MIRSFSGFQFRVGGIGSVFRQGRVVPFALFPTERLTFEDKVLPFVQALFRLGETLRSGFSESGYLIRILFLRGEIVPFVRVMAEVVEFFALLPVMDVTPIPIDDGDG